MSQTRPSPRFESRDPARRVLVLDMPGHHGSPFCQRALPDVAAAIASAGEDTGLDRPVIAGHSISAVIATVYASAYPTSDVVNVDQVIDMSFVRKCTQAKWRSADQICAGVARDPGEHAYRAPAREHAAAAQILHEGGVDALSVRSVAARIGASTRAVYSVFGSNRLMENR